MVIEPVEMTTKAVVSINSTTCVIANKKSVATDFEPT